MFQSGRSRSLLAKVTEKSDFMNKMSPGNFINNAMTFTLGTSCRLQRCLQPKNSADSFNNFSSVITFSHARARTFYAPLIAREKHVRPSRLTPRRVRETWRPFCMSIVGALGASCAA